MALTLETKIPPVFPTFFVSFWDRAWPRTFPFLHQISALLGTAHRRTGNFLPGGGDKPFAQKILATCPNFYETVEKKRGPYDATT